MKAVLVSKLGRVLKEYPIPSPAAGELLIKNVTVASNPKDWKLPFYLDPYAAVEGNDVAGYVEHVGDAVTDFKKGDKVAAFTKMRSGDKYGAYAEYSVSPANTVFHLGPKTSFEDAVTLPLAYMTAAIGLHLRLGLPSAENPAKVPIPVLIYGASTTVGVFAIQLAKLAGLYVVGVAGASGELAKSYGADEIIDYRNKSADDISNAIIKAGGGKIKHAYDTISEKGTLEIIAKALDANGGGKITYTLTYSQEELDALPKSVSTERTLVATAHTTDAEFAREWFARAGEWLEDAKFRGQKVTIVPGGLNGVAEGLKRLQNGTVSGEKLVYRIAET